MARGKVVADEAAWRSLGISSESPDAAIPNRAEDIAARVQDFIVSGGLEDGARLPSERDLAEWLSTSRATVSQAVRMLVVRGLVESRRGSGAYVRHRPEASMAASVDLMLHLNRESVPHLSELRLHLESTGVSLAIDRAGDRGLRDAKDSLEALRLAAGDTAAWMSADTRFHAALVGASGNPYLLSIYESVHATLVENEYRDWIERDEVPEWLRPEQSEAQFALHAPILEGVLARDREAALAAVRHHHGVMSEHLALGRL